MLRKRGNSYFVLPREIRRGGGTCMEVDKIMFIGRLRCSSFLLCYQAVFSIANTRETFRAEAESTGHLYLHKHDRQKGPWIWSKECSCLCAESRCRPYWGLLLCHLNVYYYYYFENYISIPVPFSVIWVTIPMLRMFPKYSLFRQAAGLFWQRKIPYKVFNVTRKYTEILINNHVRRGIRAGIPDIKLQTQHGPILFNRSHGYGSL